MSNNLGISQITPNQLNKSVTQNDAHGELDAAITEDLDIAVTSSNAVTLSTAQFQQNNFFRFSDGGATSQVTITVPAIKRGFFLVKNATGFPLKVEIASQTVLDTMSDGETAIWYCDAINCFLPRAQEVLGGVSAAVPAAAATAIPSFRGVSVTLTVDYLSAPSTLIPWDQESYDTDGFHDNVTNNTRITIPVGSGITKVILGANVQWLEAGTTSGFTFARIQKNGAAFIDGSSQNFRAANADPRNVIVTAPVDVVEGDYFEVFVNQSTATADIDNENSNFWLMVVESTANGQVLGHPPFDGARVYLSADQALTSNVFQVVNWDSEEYDTDNFHDNAVNNSRLTIPTGVTKVRLRLALQFEPWAGGGGTQGDIGCHFAKNGTANFRGNAEIHHQTTDNSGSQANIICVSSVIDCVAGDYFEARALQVYGVTKDLIADSGFKTWFEIEVIERVTTPHYDIETYHDGTPSSNQLIRRWSIPRLIVLPTNMTDSAAWANTAPSAQTDFDVQRNGASVGTIRFAAATNAATFIKASDTTFNPGDRLEIVAPAALNSIADLSFALAFMRSF